MTEKENELQQEIELLEKLAASGDVSIGGLQQKQRFINILNKQIEQKQSSLNEKQSEIDKINQTIEGINERFNKVKLIFKLTLEKPSYPYITTPLFTVSLISILAVI